MSECESCGSATDVDGYTTSDCAANGKPDECQECAACYCDGSC